MLTLLAPLITLAATAQASVPADLQNVHRIVMLGDSITQMGGTPKGYVTLVAETLNARFGKGAIEVVNVGISGQKAPDMSARFQRDVIDKHPQIVTISVGVNDVWHDFRDFEKNLRIPEGNSGRGIKLPIYLREVESMATRAKSAGIAVILLSPTLVYEDVDCAENKRLTTYVRAEQKLAEKVGAKFVDLNRAFKDVVSVYQRHAGKRNLLLTIDGVHMNDAGNAMMADMLLSALGVPAEDHVSPH